jgi:hypothetical protein
MVPLGVGPKEVISGKIICSGTRHNGVEKAGTVKVGTS